MFNIFTILLIAFLLLILYLFDNIKTLEDKILSHPNIKKEHLHPRKKYFQDIYYDSPISKGEFDELKERSVEKENKLGEISVKKDGDKIEDVPVKDIQDIQDIQVLPSVFPNHVPSMVFIEPEKYVLIPSMDKFISGISAPGGTTMDVNIHEINEKPLYVNF